MRAFHLNAHAVEAACNSSPPNFLFTGISGSAKIFGADQPLRAARFCLRHGFGRWSSRLRSAMARAHAARFRLAQSGRLQASIADVAMGALDPCGAIGADRRTRGVQREPYTPAMLIRQ